MINLKELYSKKKLLLASFLLMLRYMDLNGMWIEIEVINIYKKKTPDRPTREGDQGPFKKEPGNDLLSHGQIQTIIGAEQFHFWVRDGIRWFMFAMVTRQTDLLSYILSAFLFFFLSLLHSIQFRKLATVLYNCLFFKKQLGCCVAKTHGQLVLVSYVHYCTSTPSLSTL